MLEREKIYIKPNGKFLNIFYDFTKGICINIKGMIKNKIYEKSNSLYLDITIDDDTISILKNIENEIINKLLSFNLNLVSQFYKKTNTITLKIPSYRGKISNSLDIVIDNKNISLYDIEINREFSLTIILDNLWNFADNKTLYKWKLKSITS